MPRYDEIAFSFAGGACSRNPAPLGTYSEFLFARLNGRLPALMPGHRDNRPQNGGLRHDGEDRFMFSRTSLIVLRTAGSMALLAAVSACAGGPHQTTAHYQGAVQEAQQYQARAAGDYTPPGPPEDPWGPYVTEASKRFDVPERWIREVMHQESGGRLYSGSGLTTSPVGAMGLMQVMPETYDMLRARYSLGDDAYDPHNNILAGTAYVREMYDLYGSPGFLAAYNAGPGRLDDYLTRNRPLPLETRRYVASIGPHIADSFPNSRSPVEQYAMNAMPAAIPAGPRYAAEPAPEQVAYAPPPMHVAARDVAPVVAELPEPPALPPVSAPAFRAPAPHPMAVAEAQDLPEPPAAPARGFRAPAFRPTEVAELPEPARPVAHGLHLIQQAMAEPIPAQHHGSSATGGWAIQVGAYGNEGQAHAAAANAAREAGGRVSVGSVTQGHNTLFRARLTGLSRESASQACERLAHHGGCMLLSPESQS